MSEPSVPIDQPEPMSAGLPAPPAGPPPTAIGTLEPPPPMPPASATPNWRWWLAIFGVIVLGGWAVGVTLALQSIGWFGEQLLIALDLPRPRWVWPVVGWFNAAVVAVPAAIVWALTKSPALKQIGRAWTLAAVALAALSLARIPGLAENELTLIVLAVIAGVLALLVRRRADAAHGPRGWTALAAAAGLAVLIPWLWVGAFGGVVETVLAALAAFIFGTLAGALLGRRFWLPFANGPRWRLVLAGGATAGVAFVLLAAGLGGSGTQLAAMLTLPPLGFVAAALQRGPQQAKDAPAGCFTLPLPAVSGRRVAILVGLAALGPLALIDPEELSIILGEQEMDLWALIAAGAGLAIALALALIYALGLPRRGVPRLLAIGVAALMGIGGVTVFATLGHPGWYGDRLFVKLKSQANLAGITGDQRARTAEVYHRLVAHAQTSQTGLRRALKDKGLKFTPYYLVNGVEVNSGSASVRAWLSQRSDVDTVLVSPRLRPLPQRSPALKGAQSAPSSPSWNLTMVGADQAWSHGVTGTGITVGSADSGADLDHPALRGNYRGGADSWYDPWNATSTPTDPGGHGTHTLATAVGSANVGVAPGATWMACANLARNMGNMGYYLDCWQFLLAPFPHGGDAFTDGNPARAAQVITNSWGCSNFEGCSRGSLAAAAQAFYAAGIFTAAAAGNSGPRCDSADSAPGRYADVYTVGAVNEERRVAEFSSRGPAAGLAKPNVSAPGVAVLSAVPGGGYAKLDGTSMATPHVAGVVALLWSAVPRLIGDIDGTIKLLNETATGAQDTAGLPANRCGGLANAAGAGIVSAYAAVEAARRTS